MPRWRCRCSPATIRATPTAIEGSVDFMAALRGSDRRQEDRLYARLRHLPGRSARHRRGRQGGRRPSRRRAPMSRRWRSASAARSASSATCGAASSRRSRSPRSKASSARASTSCATIATTFRRRFWHWDEIGRKMTVAQYPRRPGRAQRGVRCAAQRARPLRLPGLADAGLPRRRQCDGPQHGRAGGDQRRGDRPPDRLVHDLSDQLHRLSGRDRSGRAGGQRPARRHADRRPALCRCRRDRGERRIRAAAAVDGHLSALQSFERLTTAYSRRRSRRRRR